MTVRLTAGGQTHPWSLGEIGGCLWTKEALNHWFRVRQRKRQRDVYEDVQEASEAETVRNLAAEPPKPTRKPAHKRRRHGKTDEGSA